MSAKDARKMETINVFGALLLELSKAFDSLDHELFIANLIPMVLVYRLQG